MSKLVELESIVHKNVSQGIRSCEYVVSANTFCSYVQCSECVLFEGDGFSNLNASLKMLKDKPND